MVIRGRIARVIAGMVCVLVLCLPVPAPACPFCTSALSTLSEQLEQANAAGLGSWVSAEKPTEEKVLGETTFKIERLILGPETLVPGTEIKCAGHQKAKPGDRFVLFGNFLDKGSEIEWVRATAVTDASFRYIADAPPRKGEPTERLLYYIRFLDSPEELISNDAFAEFANADYADLLKIRQQIPRDKVRAWLAAMPTNGPPQPGDSRRGFYGLLLGLSGDDSDAQRLEQQIFSPRLGPEFKELGALRLGLDGLIGGYLLLRGEAGLKEIDTRLIKREGMDFSEYFASMQALLFLWSYSPDTIPKARLQESMRLLLDQPQCRELAIANLARWKDWSVQDRLIQIYQTGDPPAEIRFAIARYLVASSRDEPDSLRARRARSGLETLRRKDPQTIQSAERYISAG